MKGSIQYGSRRIDFFLEFSKRKSLGITVDPDMQVMVKAPEGTALERIDSVILKKAAWIIKQQSFFLSFHPKMPPRQYVNGETHLYLGRQYQLKIEEQDKEALCFSGRYMIVTVKEKERVRQLVKGWYRERAKMKFADIAEPLIQQFEKYKVKPSGLYVQEMQTRWGSCTPKGKIILNPELLKAPKGCIEYVIVHELCHLVHRHHTRKFFDLQKKEMPDWEKWKNRLENLL